MKVLMTTDTVGGVWTYAMELCRSLQPLGASVMLATMGGPVSDEQRDQAAALPNVRLCDSLYKLEWMQNPWEDVKRAGHWLLELESDFRPDVIHLNGYAHGTLPFRAPTVVVGHSCVLSWWQAVKGEAAPPEWERYRRAVAEGLHSADMVVAPTQAMLDALEQHYGRLPRRQVIHNARDPWTLRPGRKEPFILSAGRLWDEAKNVTALQRIARTLPWPICVAGEQTGPEGAGANVNGVRALGRLRATELANCMGRAAIYALPARYEPFGLSIMEAALSGCALVLGDIPSLREVWGDAATFVPPDDAAALTEAVGRLISHRPHRDRMAARAYQRAREYAPEAMAGKYMSTYRQLHAAARSIERTEAAREPVAPFAQG